ncbi:MAG: hypothetical protein ACFE94_14605 [Candidatus Hodarchaeota archaeon]
MTTLTENQVQNLTTRFDTVPYSTFFKLWYALQKALPADKKGEIFTKIGRTIGREFDEKGVNTIDDFMKRLEQFLEQEWAITDNAKVEVVKDEDGEVIKLIAKQDSCKMCFANTYYRFHDKVVHLACFHK